MCGIVGLIRHRSAGPDDRALVERMAAALRHRGPDGAGVWSAGSGTLGHRRLAVVDLSDAAAQPMTAGEVGLTYNGETYDHLALRDELARAGAAFTSRSDTEVVLRGYLAWGEAVVERLDGMFALGVWDAARGRLLLARDRYGEKPLYYVLLADGGLAFASEPRALRLLPPELLGHPWQVDRAALAQYLATDTFPGETTVWRGVRKLPPGATLVWEAGRARLRRYWTRRYGHLELGAREAEARLWELLVRAVERRLMSDVPLGVFLSGGLDSSAVLAAAAEVTDAARLRTFAIGFREASYDESPFAAAVARHVGARHDVLVLDAPELLAHLPEVLDHLDEPLADASVVPTYALCKFARREVTVALGGDGGDELLCGYDTFVAERLARPYLRLPRLVRAPLEAAALRLPASPGRMSAPFLARRFVRGLDPDPLRRNVRWFGSFLPEEASALVIGAPSPSELFAELERGPRPAGEEGVLDLWTRWYLPDDVLTKVDRASMAVSLEARAPFLDPELAAFAHGLPLRYKLRGLTRKWLLKRALRGRLPQAVLRRRKQGFAAPVADWLRGPLRAELLELLAPAALERAGLLRPEPVQRLVREHLAGRDHRKELWALYVLQRWLARRGPEAP